MLEPFTTGPAKAVPLKCLRALARFLYRPRAFSFLVDPFCGAACFVPDRLGLSLASSPWFSAFSPGPALASIATNLGNIWETSRSSRCQWAVKSRDRCTREPLHLGVNSPSVGCTSARLKVLSTRHDAHRAMAARGRRKRGLHVSVVVPIF
jgi:hypothetical protein